MTRQYVPAESVEEQWDIPLLEKILREEWQVDVSLQEEVSDALRWIQEFGRIEKPEHAWALFCQSLFAANEFIYLR